MGQGSFSGSRRPPDLGQVPRETIPRHPLTRLLVPLHPYPVCLGTCTLAVGKKPGIPSCLSFSSSTPPAPAPEVSRADCCVQCIHLAFTFLLHGNLLYLVTSPGLLLWKHFVWALVLIHARGSISVGTAAPETGPQVRELGSPVWGGPGTRANLGASGKSISGGNCRDHFSTIRMRRKRMISSSSSAQTLAWSWLEGRRVWRPAWGRGLGPAGP